MSLTDDNLWAEDARRHPIEGPRTGQAVDDPALPYIIDPNAGGTPDYNSLEDPVGGVIFAVRPLLRLLFLAGFHPDMVYANPRTPEAGTAPVIVNVADNTAAGYDSWAPETERALEMIDIPNVGRSAGLAIRFRYFRFAGYCGRLLFELDDYVTPLTSDFRVTMDPDEQGIATLWLDMPGFPSGGSIGAFVYLVAQERDRFVDDYLNAVGQEAASYGGIFRPVGPTGLLTDPLHLTPQFRWGEKREARRARLNMWDTIHDTIWADAGSTPAALVAYLRKEIQGNPGTGNAPAPVPLTEHLAGASDPKGMAGQWQAILTTDVRTLEATYNGKHWMPPVPTPDELANMSHFSVVADALSRRMFVYEASPHEGPFTIRAAGFDMRSNALAPVEAWMSAFIQNWDINRAGSIKALRTIYSMLWDIRDTFLGSPEVTGDPNAPNTVAPDISFAAELDAAFDFYRTILYYPTEPATILTEVKAAYEKVEDLIDLGIAEAQANRDSDTFVEVVPISTLYETWEQIGIACAMADRFFYNGEFEFRPSDMMRAFLDGISEGIAELEAAQAAQTEVSAEDAEAMTAGKLYLALTYKVVEAAPVNALFPHVLLAGMVWGAGEHVAKTFDQVINVIADPEAFIDRCADLIALAIDTRPNDLAHALGKGFAEQVIKQGQALVAAPNPVVFVFEIGRVMGPTVLEIIVGLISQTYVVAPLVHIARGPLVTVFKAAMQGMPGEFPNVVRAAAHLDIDAPGTPMRVAADIDVIDADSGPRPDTMSPDQLDALDLDETQGLSDAQIGTAIDDLTDAQRATTPPTADADNPFPADFGAPVQREVELRIKQRKASLKFLIDDFMDRLENGQLSGVPTDFAPPTRTEVARVRQAINRMLHKNYKTEGGSFDTVVHLMLENSQFSDLDKARMLKGMVKLRESLATDDEFRAFINHYARQSPNCRVLAVLGRDEVLQLETERFLSASYPGENMQKNLPRLIAQAFKESADLEDAIKDLPAPTKGKILKAWKDKDFVQDRMNTLPSTSTPDFPRPYSRLRAIMEDLPSALWATFLDGYKGYGLMRWANRAHDRHVWEALPHPDFPGKPGSMEMWLTRNFKKRTADELAESAAVSAPYNTDPANRFNGGHLIAHRHGGPSVPENLVPVHQNTNVSYMAEVERHVDWLLAAHDDVYLRVRVNGYDRRGLPTSVNYEAFVPDANGRPRLVDEFAVMANHRQSINAADCNKTDLFHSSDGF